MEGSQVFLLIGVENAVRFAQSSAMIRWRILSLLLALAVCGGCTDGGKNAASPATGPEADPILPTGAQPKLQTMKLWLGAEEMVAELALTGVQMQTGMMFRTNLAENAGMLFVFGAPYRASFWMKNCPESISAAYISTDGVIAEIHHLEKNDTNAVVAAADNIQFVLETKDGWFARHNINPGTVIRTDKGSLAETFFRN